MHQGNNRPKLVFFDHCTVRLYPDEWEFITREAAATNTTVSKWIATKIDQAENPETIDRTQDGKGVTVFAKSRSLCFEHNSYVEMKEKAQRYGKTFTQYLVDCCLS